MHYLPSLDQQAPENPSIFQDNSAPFMLAQVQALALAYLGMDQVVLAGAGFGAGSGSGAGFGAGSGSGAGSGYRLLWSCKMSLP